MGRRIKRPKPPPRVWRERERQMSDQVQLVQLPQMVPAGAVPLTRLGTCSQRFPLDGDVIAASLNFCPNGVIFCDSTVFLAPTHDRIWTAILQDHRLAVIPPILDEL